MMEGVEGAEEVKDSYYKKRWNRSLCKCFEFSFAASVHGVCLCFYSILFCARLLLHVHFVFASALC